RLRRSPDRILCHLPGGYRFGLVGTPLGPDVSRRRAGYQKERKHRGQQAFSHSRSSGRQSRVAGRAPPNSFGNEAIGTLVIGELIENKVLPFVARSALNRRRAVPKRRAKSARDFCRSTPPRRGKGICKVWLKPVHTRHCGAWLQMGIECWRVLISASWRNARPALLRHHLVDDFAGVVCCRTATATNGWFHVRPRA